MLEEKRNSTVLRQFWFVDVENTLPAIMVERVLCIYWDYSSISIFSSDLSSTVKWSSQTVIRSSQRFTRASSMYFSFRTLTRAFIVSCKVMIPVFCIQRTAIRQNIDYLKQLIKIFILLFGKLQILFKLIGKLNVVFHTSRAALSASILE